MSSDLQERNNVGSLWTHKESLLEGVGPAPVSLIKAPWGEVAPVEAFLQFHKNKQRTGLGHGR